MWMLIDSEKLKQAILTYMPERSEVLLIVDNQPEAVVRCPGCVYKNTCISTKNRVEPDGFCKWGETVTNIYG
jgi:hypothetical protein